MQRRVSRAALTLAPRSLTSSAASLTSASWVRFAHSAAPHAVLFVAALQRRVGSRRAGASAEGQSPPELYVEAQLWADGEPLGASLTRAFWIDAQF